MYHKNERREQIAIVTWEKREAIKKKSKNLDILIKYSVK